MFSISHEEVKNLCGFLVGLIIHVSLYSHSLVFQLSHSTRNTLQTPNHEISLLTETYKTQHMHQGP